MKQSANNNSVSLRDVAKESGYALTTVSMALRNHSKIAENTKKKIIKIANEMGYSPDPHVSGVMNYMRMKRTQKTKAELAFITTCSHYTRLKNHPIFYNYLLGAKKKAKELGFSLVRFDTEREGLTENRLMGILESRGIDGIMLAPYIGTTGKLEIDFSKFASITFGYSFEVKNINRITLDHYLAAQLVMKKISEHNIQKMGIVIPKAVNARLQYRWIGALFAYIVEYNLKYENFPLYEEDYNKESFLAWFKKHKPDTILSPSITWARFLYEEGINCPKDYRFISLEHESISYQCEQYEEEGFTHEFSNATAIHQDSYFTGEQAVDLLNNEIALNKKGLSEHPSITMISPKWNDGTTLA